MLGIMDFEKNKNYCNIKKVCESVQELHIIVVSQTLFFLSYGLITGIR